MVKTSDQSERRCRERERDHEHVGGGEDLVQALQAHDPDRIVGRPEGARTSSRVARTGGFAGLRWAGAGGMAKGPRPTEPDVATRSRESNVATNTSTPR